MLARGIKYKFETPTTMKVTFLSGGETITVSYGAIFSVWWGEDDSIFALKEDGSSYYIKPNYIYVEFPDVSNG